jgi:hypothetical protein
MSYERAQSTSRRIADLRAEAGQIDQRRVPARIANPVTDQTERCHCDPGRRGSLIAGAQGYVARELDWPKERDVD